VPEVLADAVTRLFSPDGLAIVLLDVAQNQLVMALRTGAAPDSPDHPLLQLAMREGAYAIVHDVAGALASRGLHTPPDLPGSWVGAPIVVGGRTAGAISVSADDDGRYREFHRALLGAIAAQCAIALEGTRRFQLLSQGKVEWEQTVDSITQAICIVDASGTVRRANRPFALLVDVPVTTISGRPWLALLPPAWADAVGTLLARPAGQAPIEVRAANRMFTVTAHPLIEAGAGVMALVFDDLTDKRRLQEQLIQSEKMSAIGQLLAGVAHDLNNPLASVVGFSDYLNETGAVPEALREPLAVIQQEAERAANIVKNLLNFARRQEGERIVTGIRPILNRTLALLRSQLMAHRIETAMVVEPDLPEVEVDPNQLQQVFVNLLNNATQAIAATGEAGHITITARHWLDGLAVLVSDDGPGISPEVRARIFEPFFTTKAEGHGTGLGLSICQGILREHGGRITAEAAPGRGTTFSVELPAAPQTERRAPPGGSRGPARPLTVLVVDDEPHILHYMRATLESWGHTVRLAADGFEALDLVAAEAVDLVVSDLRMPRLGGREFHAALVERDPAMAERIVFSTGDTIRDEALSFLEGLHRPYLTKPFKLAELRQLVDHFARTQAADRLSSRT